MAEVLSAAEGLPAGVRMLWAASASGITPPSSAGPARKAGASGRPRSPAAVLVTDGAVARLYADSVPSLDGRVSIMPGEQSKLSPTPRSSGPSRPLRDDTVRRGGGVGGRSSGDLAGFCAATYQRGVRYVQVPHDARGPGRLGLRRQDRGRPGGGQDYVGAYHQPQAVIADTNALQTLPPAELAAGYAEMVKTALIAGGRLWDQIRAEPIPLTRA